MGIDVEGFRQGQRTMWTAGDYAEVALRIVPVGEYVAERAGAAPGVELLDVATGTGNVSVPAAKAGATVTGLDLTPKLLEVQRERAAAEGVSVTLVEGDAEALPFAEASFDRVTSCFGVMFAPRHAVAAAELVRVARPGGEIVVAAWKPDGFVGRLFRLSASYTPQPPEGFMPAAMWGSEAHVRELFAPSGAELSFEHRAVPFEHESPEAWIERDERILGPSLLAKAALEQQGRYEELREEMVKLHDDANEATDGTFLAQAEYLVTIARVPG